MDPGGTASPAAPQTPPPWPNWKAHACDPSGGPSSSLPLVDGFANPHERIAQVVAGGLEDEVRSATGASTWGTRFGQLQVYPLGSDPLVRYSSSDPERVTEARVLAVLEALGVDNATLRTKYSNSNGGNIVQVVDNGPLQGTSIHWINHRGRSPGSQLSVSALYQPVDLPDTNKTLLSAVASDFLACWWSDGHPEVRRVDVGGWSARSGFLGRVLMVMVETPGRHCTATTYSIDVDPWTHAILHGPSDLCY
jgi:hypothetical protein